MDLQKDMGGTLTVNNDQEIKALQENLKTRERIVQKLQTNKKFFDEAINHLNNNGLVNIKHDVMKRMFPKLKDYLSNPNLTILVDKKTLPRL